MAGPRDFFRPWDFSHSSALSKRALAQTILIEDGKITKVVNNLRFTENISDIIKGITEIENKSYTIPYSSNYGEFGIYSARMPHVKVNGFKISSSTKTV